MPTFFNIQNKTISTPAMCVADVGHIFFPHREMNIFPFQRKGGNKSIKWQLVLEGNTRSMFYLPILNTITSCTSQVSCNKEIIIGLVRSPVCYGINPWLLHDLIYLFSKTFSSAITKQAQEWSYSILKSLCGRSCSITSLIHFQGFFFIKINNSNPT